MLNPVVSKPLSPRLYAFVVVGIIALMSWMRPVAAEDLVAGSASRSGNPVLGKLKSADGRCQECHGEDGLSSDAKIPNHAGQLAGYLVKQLNDFKSGTRQHVIMTLMAEDLSVADRADIAAYFSSQKTMQGEGSGDRQLTRNLFVNGDQSRGIPACASCHGENGKGRLAENVFYPVIGGQRAVYLRTQLLAWKLGDRSNSPGGVMTKVGLALSDDEIAALADYISGL
jgi:cytochrome c553